MKDMKKVILKLTLVAAFVVSAGYSVYTSQVNEELSDLALANIEALAGGELGGNTVDCYSSSLPKKGATYYDCGLCRREYNSKGDGNARQCIVRN